MKKEIPISFYPKQVGVLLECLEAKIQRINDKAVVKKKKAKK